MLLEAHQKVIQDGKPQCLNLFGFLSKFEIEKREGNFRSHPRKSEFGKDQKVWNIKSYCVIILLITTGKQQGGCKITRHKQTVLHKKFNF